MRLSKLAGVATVAASLAAATAVFATGTLRFGAMPVGTGWYVAGAAITQELKPVLPKWDVELIPRGGGVSNPMVVNEGKADLGFANVATSVWAERGAVIYHKKATHIRALIGGLNPVYLAMMVRNDFIKRTGLDTMDKIFSSGKPLRIVMKPQGSTVPPAVDMILSAYGLDRAKIKANGGEIIQVSSAQIPDIVREGRADIYFDSVVKGHPTITEVALTGNVRFVDLSQKVRDKLAQNGLKPEKFPEWFKGQNGPTWGADFGTELIARDSVPDEVAYKVVKTFMENLPNLVKAYPAYAAFKPQDAAKKENTGIQLHPGAAKYYKEHHML